MKLGNTSQTLITVPKFFYTKSEKDVDILNNTQRKKYFREKDLFNKSRDLNFCNNQRKNFRNFEHQNVEKYIPIHKMEATLRSFSENKQTLHSTHKSRTDMSDDESVANTSGEYDKFTKYMKDTNITLQTKGDLRDEIRGNISNLINKINTNFDIDRWNKTDTRSQYNYNNSNVYSPLTLFNMTNFSEQEKFTNTLRDKVSSLKEIDNNVRKKSIKHIDRMKYQCAGGQDMQSMRVFTSDVDSKIIKNYDMTGTMSNTLGGSNTKSDFNKTARLSSTYQLEKDNFKTVFLNDFKKPKWRKKEKKTNILLNPEVVIKDSNYNFTKHRDMNCEKDNYNLNDGALKRFRLQSEMKSVFS